MFVYVFLIAGSVVKLMLCMHKSYIQSLANAKENNLDFPLQMKSNCSPSICPLVSKSVLSLTHSSWAGVGHLPSTGAQRGCGVRWFHETLLRPPSNKSKQRRAQQRPWGPLGLGACRWLAIPPTPCPFTTRGAGFGRVSLGRARLGQGG